MTMIIHIKTNFGHLLHLFYAVWQNRLNLLNSKFTKFKISYNLKILLLNMNRTLAHSFKIKAVLDIKSLTS